MKKVSMILALALPVLFVSCQKEGSLSQSESSTTLNKVTGNGAPAGYHYNLNIIGVPQNKTADMTGTTGGRIFVKLTGNTKIKLTPAPAGESFAVLDANGTDVNGATFQLPVDVTQKWTVWARVPGNQSGNATITTCADSVWDGSQYVAAEISCGNPINLSKVNAGKFINVSSQLLTVTVLSDVYVNGVKVLDAGTYDLFDEALAGYFWDYDNEGLKILQLRFYPNMD